jgi:mRNA interferase MazF
VPDYRYGEIWIGELDPTRGHEQSGTRPVLVISDDAFNASPADLVVVLPLTTKDKRIAWHVAVEPPEGGLRARSYIKCEDIRSIAKARLRDHVGSISTETVEEVAYRLRMLLRLDQ